MKTLTLVCNFVLLGIAGLGIITGGLSENTGMLILSLLAIGGSMLNIILVAGSDISLTRILSGGSTNPDTIRKRLHFFPFMKILAIILNSLLIVIVAIEADKGSGYLFPYIIAFVILSLVLSIARITIGKWSRFADLKRTILLTGSILVLLFAGTLTALLTMIRNGIKENISIVKKEYPGKAEDALLAYLADSTKSPRDRTHIAVWTLGQIRSRKALPVLNSLYRNDPLGKTCRHESEVCQYEIHKAIVLIESKWQGAKEKNVFVSWARLNK